MRSSYPGRRGWSWLLCIAIVIPVLIGCQHHGGEMFLKDPNRAGPDGHPIIFTEMERMNLPKVRRLIKAGADIEAKGYAQGTPILLAAVSENWLAVEILLEAGADPMVTDQFGMTVTWLAATSRLLPESEQGQALDRVRHVLNERGIIGIVVDPREVTTMHEEGRWPPEH